MMTMRQMPPSAPERLRVGILTTEFPTHGNVGGLSAYCWQLYQGLEAAGHEPHVLLQTAEFTNAKFTHECRVHLLRAEGISARIAFPFGRGSSLMLGRKIAGLVERLHLDIVEASDVGSLSVFVPMPLPNRAALVVRLHTGRKLLKQYRNGAHPPLRARARMFETIAAWVERRAISKADALSAVSQAVIERTSSDLGLLPRDVSVIPNPVSTELFHRGASTPESPGHVVCVGRLAWVKGIDLLVDAWALVAEADPSARLTVAGEDSLCAPGGSSMKSYLQRKIAASGLQASISLTGYIEPQRVPALLDSASLCVFPSRWEGMSLALIEAMGCGKCCIASQAPAMRETIEHGMDGVIVNAEDAPGFAAQILRLLNSPAERAQLGQAARSTAMKRFARTEVVRQTVELYRDTWARRNRKS